MTLFSANKVFFIAFCAVSLTTNAIANEEITGKPTWAGKGPSGKTSLIDVDCGDIQYTLSIEQASRKKVLLKRLDRFPEQFSADVSQKFGQVINEFFRINTITFSCGVNLADNSFSIPNSPDNHQDFTGQLQVYFTGIHSKNTYEAEQNCHAKNGEFAEETWRYVTLKLNSVNVYPDIIGTCSDN